MTVFNLNICSGTESTTYSSSTFSSTSTSINSTTSSTLTTTNIITTTTITATTTTVPMPSFYIFLEVTLSINGTFLNEDELKSNYSQWVYDKIY